MKMPTAGIAAASVAACAIVFCLGVWWAGGRILPEPPRKEPPNLAQQLIQGLKQQQEQERARQLSADRQIPNR